MALTVEEIQKKITKFEGSDWTRLNRLYEYYIGKHKILGTTKDPGKPNNRLVTNFAKNIVNNTTGYFMGEPVTYNCSDDELGKRIQDIVDYNDDAFVNTGIAEHLSIFGMAAELLYIENDEDAHIRYARINPMQLYIETTQDVNDSVVLAIRWYDVFDDDDIRTRHIEVYDDKTVSYYVQRGGGGRIEEEIPEGQSGSVVEHYWGEVPINVYYNNDFRMGDFEDVMPLIDAYNTMQSESVNDYQSFADAILILKNTKLPTEIDPITGKQKEVDLRERKSITVYDEGDVSYLVKQVNDTYVENIKNRIQQDIYLSSNTVNMSDDNFAGNMSGVAIRYKLMNFENRVSKTERYFTRGLQRRFELICNILNLKSGPYDYTTILPQFTRNIPANLSEIATEITQLQGVVSQKTLLAQIPFITDPEQELKQLEEERAQYNMTNFGRADEEDTDDSADDPDDDDEDPVNDKQ